MPAIDSHRALIERLANHKALLGVPEPELRWLAKHGTLVHYDTGDIIARHDQPVNSMYIILAGTFTFYADRGGVRRKVAEWGPGSITGLLPYSRMKN